MIGILDTFAVIKEIHFLQIGMHPCGHFSIFGKFLFPLPENQKIRKGVCAGSFKQLVWQPDSTDQLPLLGKFSPYRIVLFIHCAVTCNRNNKSARSNLIHHLLQKVIVNKIIPVILVVRDDIVAKRYIGNCEIKRILREVAALEAFIQYGCTIRRKACDLCGQCVEFNADSIASFFHGIRHIMQKTARAG